MNIIVNELLSTAFDKSEVFNSETYKQLETKLTSLNDILIAKVDDTTFNAYYDTRTDFELLFYQYGFLEGIKFINTLMRTPVEKLLNSAMHEK